MGDPGPLKFTMTSSHIAKANVAELVDNLTTDEAISLIAGVGFWHTHEVSRLGIPAIKVCN
jgi:beta-glucosidase